MVPGAAGLSSAAPGAIAAQMDQPNDTVLDLRGIRCPHVVLRAKKALRNVAIGDALVLECTDPLAEIDVPVFVQQTGHMLSEQTRRNEIYVYRIVKRH